MAGGRVLKWARLLLGFFSRCRKSALLRRWLVASRQSWDADWSQIGTLLEALISRKSAILRRWLVANRHSWDADWFEGCVPIMCMWQYFLQHAVANTKCQGVKCVFLGFIIGLVCRSYRWQTHTLDPHAILLSGFGFGLGRSVQPQKQLKWTHKLTA